MHLTPGLPRLLSSPESNYLSVHFSTVNNSLISSLVSARAFWHLQFTGHCPDRGRVQEVNPRWWPHTDPISYLVIVWDPLDGRCFYSRHSSSSTIRFRPGRHRHSGVAMLLTVSVCLSLPVCTAVKAAAMTTPNNRRSFFADFATHAQRTCCMTLK